MAALLSMTLDQESKEAWLKQIYEQLPVKRTEDERRAIRQQLLNLRDRVKDAVEEGGKYSSILKQLHEQLLEGLKHLQLKLGPLQVVSPFIHWIWPDSEHDSIHPTVFGIVDQIPSVGKFYRPSTAGLYNSYKSMLTSAPRLTIDFLSTQEMQDAEEKVLSTWDCLKQAEEKVKEAWIESFKKDPDLIYGEWFVSSGWTETLEEIQTNYNEAIQEKTRLIEGHNQEYESALAAVTLPKGMESSKKGFVKCDINGQLCWRPEYILANGENWTAQSNTGDGPIKFDLSVIVDEFLDESNFGLPDIVRQSISNILKDNVTITYELDELKRVPVEPGEWFDQGFLKKLAQDNQWNEPFTNDNVFGKDGILSIRIATILAAYKLRFTVILPHGVYHALLDLFRGLDQLKLGPIRFRKDEWVKYWDDSKFMLRGETTSDQPFIIGFIITDHS